MRERIVAALGVGLLAFLATASAAPSAAPEPPTAPTLAAAADSAYRASRFAAAESLATRAIELFETSAIVDSVLLADSYRLIGVSRVARRLHADSLAYKSLTRALELYELTTPAFDPHRGDTHNALAALLNSQNHAELAIEHARKTLEIRRAAPGENGDLVSLALENLGLVYRRLAEPDSALAALREALAIREPIAPPRDVYMGNFHADMAQILDDLGELDAAREEITAAMKEYEERLGPNDPAVILGLQNAATIEFHAGDLARSVELTQRAADLALATPGYNAVKAQLIRGNLATALIELGDYERASRILESALPTFLEALGPKHRQTAWVRSMLGMTHAMTGDTTAAIADYEAIRVALEGDPTITDTGVLTLAYTGLADLLKDSDPKSALPLMERAETMERARPAPRKELLTATLLGRIDLQMKLGNFAAMDSLDATVENSIDENGLRGTKMDGVALGYRSRAAQARGDREAAVTLAADGAKLLREIFLENVRALPDRLGLLFSSNRSEVLATLLDFGAVDGTPGASVAWDELVRTRGLVSAEIANRRPPLGMNVAAAAATAHAEWMEARRRVAQFEVHLGARGRDEEGARRLAVLHDEADQAELRWAKVAPRGEGERDPSAIGLADVRAALPAGEALVSFAYVDSWRFPDRLVAFVAKGGADSIRVVEFGSPDSLARAVARWKELASTSPLQSPHASRECRTEGAKVRALTWDILAPHVKGSRVVHLVLDRPLHSFPWGALPDGKDLFHVETGPTIVVHDAERELVDDEAPAAPGAGLLAVGGVDFDETLPEEDSPTGPTIAMGTRGSNGDCIAGMPRRVAGLPGTEAEVRAIEGTWPGATVLTGKDATESAFKEAATGRAALHLATHGVVLQDSCAQATAGTRGVGGVEPLAAKGNAKKGNGGAPRRNVTGSDDLTQPESPWLGRRVLLAFAGANRAAEHVADENEGWLTADEVTTLDLRGTQWVVLSACRSGVADSWGTEGVLGMRRAFRLAGARSVIASEWDVDDDAAREWMEELYAARERGAAAATQQASRAVLQSRRARGESVHPFYWAAFTATGE